ncbi:MAG TPA: DUF6152 family protein [Terriglobia bacterium]|jgi:hypothetical protein|nr:DUF6152 family protein [Terriglobia bacterium]
MKRNSLIAIGLCVGLLTSAIPLLAHHAISAEFDTAKPIKFEGTVKSVDWMNPHIYVNIEAVENGKSVVYSVEGGPPNALFRQGWRPDSLKVGDKVQVSGVRAKKPESNRIGQAQITMPDGRVFARGATGNN